MITLDIAPGAKVLELGGGANRHPQATVNVDVRQAPGVDFTADFNKPLPIKSDEFDVTLSVYCLEHITWRDLPGFVNEIYRVTKPGGRAILVTPNTQEQLRYILSNRASQHKDGEFVESSRILFGDLDYPENSHKSFLSPTIVQDLLSKAGFQTVATTAFGELGTDMVVEASKPFPPLTVGDVTKMVQVLENGQVHAPAPQQQPPSTPPAAPTVPQPAPSPPVAVAPPAAPEPPKPQINNSTLSTAQRAKLFNKSYFNGGYYRPWHWDEPRFETIARHVLARKPTSVLELGCSRGYVLKRLEDAGIHVCGLEISKHCQLTKVVSGVIQGDILDTPHWPRPDAVAPGDRSGKYDFCLSVDVLDRIPEDVILMVCNQMRHVSDRGLHTLHFKDIPDDPTRCTVKPIQWWKARLPEGHEIVEKNDLEAGALPPEVLMGDGQLKLNIGCALTMFHHGWTNIDTIDGSNFAQSFNYKFMRYDVRGGIPCKTGEAKLIYACHFLEHLTYDEGKRFLKECRRALHPEGALRLIVPDAGKLMEIYEEDWEVFGEFDEINDNCERAKTAAGKLWSILHEGHSACYDHTTLEEFLKEAGFDVTFPGFREDGFARNTSKQMLKETLDMLPCISLYADAIPKLA